MDLKLLEYIVAIDDSRNITKAAESLFISQSGLNQQLIKLENELGVQLFTRNKKFVSPTPAGKIYLRYAREMLNMKRHAYAEIMDIKENVTGDIFWGLTYEHGVDLFLSVSQELRKQYPGITLHLKEHSVATLNQMLRKDVVDLAFVMLREQDEAPGFEYQHICREKLLLGIPSSYPEAKNAAPKGEPLKTIDISLMKDRTFSLMFSGSTQRRVIDAMFAKAGYSPKLFCETRMNRTLLKLVEHQACCAIIPQSYARYQNEIAWFELEGESSWNWALCWKSGTKPTKPTRLLLELSMQYAQKVMEYWETSMVGNPYR